MKSYFTEENGKEYFVPPLPASIKVKSQSDWSDDYLEFRLQGIKMMANALSNLTKCACELYETNKKEDKEKAKEITKKISEFCEKISC